MKTKIFSSLITIALLCTSLASCISDESEYVGTEVSDIEVSGIDENYEVVSYSGQHLKISPVVKTKYTNLRYEWYLCSKQTGYVTAKGDTIQPVLIGTEKDLDYEVNVAPTQYQLRLKCISETGFVRTVWTSFSAVTEFSKGFYIMKETSDGNTDLDLFTLSGKKTDDLLAATQGKSLKGAPLMLNLGYDGFYINEESNQMEGTNKIIVTTEDGDFGVYRCTDLKLLFDRSNIKFEPMAEDEKVISIYNSERSEVMLTTKGVYNISNNNNYVIWGYINPNSGRYPMPSEAHCSRYFVPDFPKAYGSGILWDDKECSIKAYSETDGVSAATNKTLEPVAEVANLTGTKCLYSGFCNSANKTFMLLEGADGKRRIANFTGTYIRAIFGYICAYTGIFEVSPSSHLAKASIFATCGWAAPYLYAVDGNKLYGVNLNTEDLPELELQLDGISSSEKITYVTNQYDAWTANSYDYLIVGTESGDSYNLYFYECSNGIPTGQPVMKTSGKGKVKGVRFLTDTYDSYSYRSVTD